MRIDVVSAAMPLTAVSPANATGAANATSTALSANPNTATSAVESGAAVAAAIPLQQVRNEALDTSKAEPFEMPETSLPTQEEIEKLIVRGNSLFEELRLNEHFQLRRHDKLPATMIRLVDVQNDRVIREFPPKNYLDLVAALQELCGLMMDERV